MVPSQDHIGVVRWLDLADGSSKLDKTTSSVHMRIVTIKWQSKSGTGGTRKRDVGGIEWIERWISGRYESVWPIRSEWPLSNGSLDATETIGGDVMEKLVLEDVLVVEDLVLWFVLVLDHIT